MRQVHASVSLRDGSTVLIRPIEPTDKALLVAAFERLSDESRYRRFMRPMNDLSDADLEYLTEVDHHDHEALVAISPAGDLVGVARYVRTDEPDRAEAAIAVADDWQGRGLGRILLERLVERARREQVGRFRALVLSDNRRALRVLESLGETSRATAGPQVELDIALPPETGIGPALADALRAAAAGTLVLARSARLRLAHAIAGDPQLATGPHARTDAIVVGTDGSDTAAIAVRHAEAIARALGAPLHIVSAYRGRGVRLEPPDRGVGSREDAVALLERVAGTLDPDTIDVSTHALPGEPAAALLDAAEELRSQLIVVGSRGMTGSRRFLLGSVPDRVSHHAPCNVLIVRTT